MEAATARAHDASLARHLSAIEQRAAATVAAHTQLRDEFIRGLIADPQTAVATPGWAIPSETVAGVVYDAFAGQQGDASLAELLRIVALCAEGKSGPELHLRAGAWVAGRAKEHADFHADDLVSQGGL